MPFKKYSKFTGADWESINIEELLDRLSEFLLQSGYDDPYSRYWDDGDQSLDALREAIMQALMELLSDEELDQLSDSHGNMDSEKVAELIDRIIERLIREGYIRLQGNSADAQGGAPQKEHRGRTGKPVE